MDEGSHIIEKSKLYTWLRERNSGFLSGIDKIAKVAEKQLAHQVPRLFPHYTKHDIEHSARVLNYMAELINDIDALSELEVALLVYSAILHDIGMAIGDEGIEKIKNDDLPGCSIKYSAMLKLKNGKDDLAVQDIVRRMHADISADKILNEFATEMYLPDIETVNIAEDVAAICRCHTHDVSWIASNIPQQNMKGSYTYNSRHICHILRLADLLDFDSRRAPLCLYHMLSPAGISDDEWQKHFIISNTDKVKKDMVSGQKYVVLYGKCHNARLHRQLLTYIGWIDAELAAAARASEEMPQQYRIFLREHVEHHIQTIGYSISDFRLTINFKSLSTLLMGEHIYGDKRFGLRELVQNGIDSCRVRAEIESARMKYGDSVYTPLIQIIIDHEECTVTIRDNGCGMTEATIRNYFLNIGRSYYASEEFLLQDLRYLPIGTFGIGFLACFMLSDEVFVRTRHYACGTRCDISFEKGSEFISFTRNEDMLFSGTEVVLSCQQFMVAFEDKVEKIVEYLNYHLLTDDIGIDVVDRDTGITRKVCQILPCANHREKNHIHLALDGYLNGIRGSARISKTGTCMKSVRDLDVDHSAMVLWDGTDLQAIDDYSLASILDEDRLEYISLDVFDKSDKADFRTLKERFSDIDEIIDKFDKSSTITVFVQPTCQWLLEKKETECEEEDIIIDDLTIGRVMEELGVSGFVPRISSETIEFICHPKEDIFLPYHSPKGRITDSTWWGGPRATVFVRGIRIGKAALPRLELPLFLDLKDLMVDVTHPSIVPDISRNSFDEATEKRLSYALHRAIVTSCQNTALESAEEKELMKLFLNRFYSAQDVLLRQQE